MVTVPANIANPQSPSAVSPSTPWWLSVTNNAIILCNGALTPIYVGAYDSAYSVAVDPWPICSMWLAALHNNTYWTPTANLTAGGFTRDIGGAFSHTRAGFGYVNGGVNRPMVYSTAAAQKDPISGQWVASRVTIGSVTRAAVRRGVLKPHVIAIPMVEVAVGVGDTVTVDGVQYVCLSTAGTTQQAAGVVDTLWVSTAA